MLPILYILIVNILGFILKSYGLDRHIIFLGFRFHLVTTLPVFLLFNKKIFADVIQYFKQIDFHKGFYPVFVVFLSAVVLPAVLYFANLTKYTDPDYLYELGASSVIDYPIYLIWNLPQMLVFTAFLYYISRNLKFKFLIVFFVTMFSFAYEFIPKDVSTIPLNDIYILILASLLLSICSLRLNIYLCSIIMITIFWAHILVFGNLSVVLLNLLLARNYNTWEGILVPDKILGNYILLIQLSITIILFLPTLLLNSYKRNIKS